MSKKYQKHILQALSLSFFCLSLSPSYVLGHKQKNLETAAKKRASISTLAASYHEFQHKFGQNEDQDYETIIPSLFSPDFKKIANGKELVSDRTKLLSQLMDAKNFAGKWTILPEETIPSKDNTKCTIRYLLNSEKGGQFEVIAILSAPNGQIEHIEEVYYQKEKEQK